MTDTPVTDLATEDANTEQALQYGYLLIVEGEDRGLTGGYLIVSERGRPLEFHCTETIVPNRAQEILFGPTLRPYLVGEQIGGALLEHAELRAKVLLVVEPDALEAGLRCGIETICLAQGILPADCPIETKKGLDRLAESIDPAEPFGRVREAVLEARRFSAGDPTHAAA